MKKQQSGTQYFFVDEAGDPHFYDKYRRLIVGKEGCSVIFLLGFIRTTNPLSLRHAVLKLHDTISTDPFYKDVPSLSRTLTAFHAKDDIPEIRERFYRTIAPLDFKAEFVVARKVGNIFASRHKNNPDAFYDDLVAKLFESKLHLHEKSIIYFATRGNKTRQNKLEAAIQKAKQAFEDKWQIQVDSEIQVLPQQPKGEPGLQIADYMNWAVYRAYTKGEDRFYKFIEEKVSFLVDVYDFKKYPKNFFTKKNKWDLNKISPL